MVYYGNLCSNALLVAYPNIEFTSVMGRCRNRGNDCVCFLADALIVNAKLVPLVPMVVGIASLSIILLFDKRNEEIENGHCHHGDLPSRYYPCWPSA